MFRQLMAGVIAAVLSAVGAVAGTMSLEWVTDKEPVSYVPGENIVFKVRLLEDGTPVSGKKLKWNRTGDDQQTLSGEAISSETPLEISTSTDKPGFVRIQVSVYNEDGSPVKDAKDHPLKFEGGAGVEPGKLAGYPEPEDFDAFWQKQKDRLAAVPIKAELKEVAGGKPGFLLYDVAIDCAGPKPVRGYMSLPENAEAKSLAGWVTFHGYGVSGASKNYQNGTIALDINAHGIENGREADYYAALKTGELKGYAFKNDENADPETCYFNGMMLRLMRALQYVKSRPEWNGRVLTVSGGSQGGLQAITAAALDPDVTKCSAYKPWCCDLGGIELGRIRGWRPDFAPGVAYYDTATMGKRISCETFITAGLGDYVCPPSGVSVLYNNIKGPKTIEYIQGSTHGYNPPNPVKQTLSTGKEAK